MVEPPAQCPEPSRGIISKQMPKPKLPITNYQLFRSGGYITLFSFLVMTTVLGTLIAVFSALALRSIFMARTSVIELTNIYAAEGFVEDTIRRVRRADWGDTAAGEILKLGRATVVSSLSEQGSAKNYSFSAQVDGKYFENEILKLEGTGLSAKIKDWQDSL